MEEGGWRQEGVGRRVEAAVAPCAAACVHRRVQQRCSGDAAAMQRRCSGDAAAISAFTCQLDECIHMHV